MLTTNSSSLVQSFATSSTAPNSIFTKSSSKTATKSKKKSKILTSFTQQDQVKILSSIHISITQEPHSRGYRNIWLGEMMILHIKEKEKIGSEIKFNLK